MRCWGAAWLWLMSRGSDRGTVAAGRVTGGLKAPVKGRQRWRGGTACAEGWGSSPVPRGDGSSNPPSARAQLVTECLAHGV